MTTPAHDDKGAYKVVLDEEQEGVYGSSRTGSLSARSPPPPSHFDHLLNHPALPVLCYCASSILMTVINKYVVSGSQFNMNFLLLTIQSVVCVSCVVVAKRLGVITFRDWDREDARKWFPISFLLVTVIYTGSKSLQYLSVPVYTIFKNLTIILIAYGEVLWFGGSVTPLTLVSFSLMVLSSLMAASTDLLNWLNGIEAPVKPGGQSSVGYAWMMVLRATVVNCFVSAGYVLAMRKRIKVTNFKDWDSMYYNNLLSIPVLVFFSVLFEDWSSENLVRNFPEETRTSLLSLMAFSGAAAVFISYCTAWTVRTTSSTTFSMVGALNKLPVAASGILFFGDPATFANVSSILVGFFAGLVYSAAKTAQSAAAKRQSSLLPTGAAMYTRRV
ncbi:GDP-mannose transporter into the lumen of the Golgi [Rhodotorula mucilaginosa]|uniref:GDP-mannose transporter n=1 Tax=Rhodotorula mucilaginosa TaxID=5537 RepID=A0A9P6W533_RHOMI|nr:GDP-mannose transporter into the lumen of the Golgi [Rhodotorula mucilaginosa]